MSVGSLQAQRENVFWCRLTAVSERDLLSVKGEAINLVLS